MPNWISLEFKEGREAYADGLDIDLNNPYLVNTEKYADWEHGYNEAKYENESED